MTVTRIVTSAVRQTMTSTSLVAQPIALITEIALGVGLVKRIVTEMLVKRNMDEMITHFNDVVSAMDISVKDKMTILGMITAIGYEYQRAADAIEKLQDALSWKEHFDLLAEQDCKQTPEVRGVIVSANHGITYVGYDETKPQQPKEET